MINWHRLEFFGFIIGSVKVTFSVHEKFLFGEAGARSKDVHIHVPNSFSTIHQAVTSSHYEPISHFHENVITNH